MSSGMSATNDRDRPEPAIRLDQVDIRKADL